MVSPVRPILVLAEEVPPAGVELEAAATEAAC